MTADLTPPVLPLRPELRGLEPYGAPQLDVPVPAQRQREPVRAVRAGRRDDRGCRRRGGRGPQPVPGPGLPGAAGRSRRLPAGRVGRSSLTPEQLWAANGSNEVMLHVLQAFGGPGRTALSFAPTYSMYPEYARDTSTGWVPAAARTTSASTSTRPAPRSPSTAPRSSCSPARTTRRARPCRCADRPRRCSRRPRSVRRRVRRGGRRGVRGVPPRGRPERPRPARRPPAPRRSAGRCPRRSRSRGPGSGYLAAAPALVDALRVVRLPYHLSRRDAGGRARGARARAAELLAQVDALRAERDAHGGLAAGTTACRSRTRTPTSRCSARSTDREAVWQGLLDRGVLIREVGPEGWLRVSIGTPQEMARVPGALVEVAGL